jgi:hypothetical protein
MASVAHDPGSDLDQLLAQRVVSDQCSTPAGRASVPFNVSLAQFPLANKWIACRWTQNNVTSDIIVFIDTDMVVFGDLRALLGCMRQRVALRPVDRRIIGAPNWCCPEGQHWQRIYHHFGISLPSIDYVKTSVDEESILGYFNSGLIAAPRSLGFFECYAYSCERVLKDRLYHPTKPQFVDQIGLSAALYGSKTRVYLLPQEFNYPIHYITRLTHRSD